MIILDDFLDIVYNFLDFIDNFLLHFLGDLFLLSRQLNRTPDDLFEVSASIKIEAWRS